MAKRIYKRQLSSRVKEYMSLVLGISACLVSAPVFADDEGSGFASTAQDLIGGDGASQASSASYTGGMSYEDALDVFRKTREHTKAAERWEQRTVPVPAGASPDRVIEQNAIKVPGIPGMDKPSPDVSKITGAKIKVQGSLEEAQKVQIPGATLQAPSLGTQQIEQSWNGQQQPQQKRAAQPAKPKQVSGLTTVFDASQPTK